MDKTKKSDRGITLITLILTIIILVILSAVAIQIIAGRNGLIEVAETASEEHDINSYKEQIEQKIRGTVISYVSEGREANISDVVKELNEESTWIKESMVDTNEEATITTVDGYVYQVYYNSTFGAIYIEYLGRNDGKEIPKINARYESKEKSINIETEGKPVTKLEVIYRGEIIGDPIENAKKEEKVNIENIRNRVV